MLRLFLTLFWILPLWLLLSPAGARLRSPRPAPLPGLARWQRRAWFAPVGRRVYFVGYVQVV